MLYKRYNGLVDLGSKNPKGGGGTPYNGLYHYGEAPPKRISFSEWRDIKGKRLHEPN